MSESHLPRRVSLVVNPFAYRVSEELVRRVEDELRPVETLLTERRGHAITLAREAAGDSVWVLGGDGLVNEVLNGLRPGVPLGVVPAGHTNVFARALGVGRGPLAQRRARKISVGRVNDRRFAFSAGIGIDSETVRAMETERRAHEGRRPGDLAYARDIVRRLLRGYEPRLEVRISAERSGSNDSVPTRKNSLPSAWHSRCDKGVPIHPQRAAILFVSNDAIFTYAGPVPLRMSPEARFELGLDFAAPTFITAASLARLMPRLAAGRGLAGASGVLSGHDLDRLEVVCDRALPLQADGEDLGDVTEAVFEAEREAVSVLA